MPLFSQDFAQHAKDSAVDALVRIDILGVVVEGGGLGTLPSFELPRLLEELAHDKRRTYPRFEIHEQAVAHLLLLIHWDSVHVECLNGALLSFYSCPAMV
jgi:hypothetical protein